MLVQWFCVWKQTLLHPKFEYKRLTDSLAMLWNEYMPGDYNSLQIFNPQSFVSIVLQQDETIYQCVCIDYEIFHF